MAEDPRDSTHPSACSCQGVRASRNGSRTTPALITRHRLTPSSTDPFFSSTLAEAALLVKRSAKVRPRPNARDAHSTTVPTDRARTPSPRAVRRASDQARMGTARPTQEAAPVAILSPAMKSLILPSLLSIASAAGMSPHAETILGRCPAMLRLVSRISTQDSQMLTGEQRSQRTMVCQDGWSSSLRKRGDSAETLSKGTGNAAR